MDCPIVVTRLSLIFGWRFSSNHHQGQGASLMWPDIAVVCYQIAFSTVPWLPVWRGEAFAKLISRACPHVVRTWPTRREAPNVKLIKF